MKSYQLESKNCSMKKTGKLTFDIDLIFRNYIFLNKILLLH